MEQSPSWEANRSTTSQAIPLSWLYLLVHYRIHKRLSLSWVRLIQSMPPHPTSWRLILLLFSHLCLDFPSSFFPSSLPTKTVYSCLLFPTSGTLLHPSHLSWFDHANNIWWGVQIMNLLHSSATLSLLGPSIYLSNLFPHTLNLCSSFSLRDKVSRP